jgi:hypothetical protein
MESAIRVEFRGELRIKRLRCELLAAVEMHALLLLKGHQTNKNSRDQAAGRGHVAFNATSESCDSNHRVSRFPVGGSRRERS